MLNRDKIIKNIGILTELLLIEKKDLIVGAGAALCLLGLRKETSDIDVSCNSRIWNMAVNRLTSPIKEIEVQFADRIEKVKIIEINYLDIDLHLDNHNFKNEDDYVEGIRIYSAQRILQQKLSMNREKDQDDIRKLKEYLNIA